MASIQKVNLKQARNGRPGVGYRVMWRDPDGRQRSKSFGRERDARAFKAEVEASMNTGAYRDPANDRVTLGVYAASWLDTKRASKRTGTVRTYESHMGRHILPTFGTRRMSAIRRSDVQAWANQLGQALSPATQRAVYDILAAVFKDAVRDRLLAFTPCDRIELRKVEGRDVQPLTAARVATLAEVVGPEYRALVVTAAGTGLRIGELLGLTIDRVDFLRRTVTVDRQMTDAGFGPPKSASSNRSVPLPDIVAGELSEHIRRHGNAADGLLFSIDRRAFYATVWPHALANAGLPETTRFHDLRHTYASLLIEAGENAKVIQSRLGHASITETFDTYGHLFPTSDDRTRQAIDAAFATSHDHVAVSLQQPHEGSRNAQVEGALHVT
jgi:integrase